MKKKCFILLAILALLLCGCQSQPDPDAISFEGKPTLPVESITELPTLELGDDGSTSNWGFDLKTEIGIFRQEDTGGDGMNHWLLTFEDFATGETYPLCTKINCTHDTRDCAAFGQRYVSLHYDGEYLYLVGVEDPYADAQTVHVVMRQKLDGTDRKVVYRPANVPENGSFNMNMCVFKDGCIYYVGYGTIFNPETAELKNSEVVYIGDLTTGETTMIPISFSDGGNGSTLNLHGMYGRELFFKRTTGGDGLLADDMLEVFFLLNVDTHEITVIRQIHPDTERRAYSYSFENGLIYFRFQKTPNEISEQATIIGDESETSYSIYDGDVWIIDLCNRKVLEIKDQHLSHDNGLEVQDGEPYWVYLTYNDDRSVVTKYAQNVTTGEACLYNEIFH